MKYMLSYAFKDLLRSKRRTILTFAVFSVGIVFYLWMVGFVQGYKKQAIENFIKFDTAHLKVRSAIYDKDDPYSISNYIQNSKEVEKVLKEKVYVKAFTERIEFLAEADNGRDSSPCAAVGIDPESDPGVFSLTNYIIRGSLERNGALLGKSLANDLGLSTGDSFFITFRSREGMIDSVELTVSGLVEARDPVVNSSMIYIRLDEAKRYLATSNVTEIAAITDNPERENYYRDDLKIDLPKNQIATWGELSAGIEGQVKENEFSTYIFIVFLSIIAVIGIVNTMLMSVYEKVREIGILKAMGMSDIGVQGIFLMEGLIIGIAGGIAGLAAGGLLVWYYTAVGMDMNAMMGKGYENFYASLRIEGTLRWGWNIPSFFYAFFFSIISSLVASYYPAKKTTMMQTAECLRTVQ